MRDSLRGHQSGHQAAGLVGLEALHGTRIPFSSPDIFHGSSQYVPPSDWSPTPKSWLDSPLANSGLLLTRSAPELVRSTGFACFNAGTETCTGRWGLHIAFFHLGESYLGLKKREKKSPGGPSLLWSGFAMRQGPRALGGLGHGGGELVRLTPATSGLQLLVSTEQPYIR